MTTNKENVSDKVTATFAIPLNPEHYELIRAAAKRMEVPAAEFGRNFLLAESAKIMEVEVPVIVKSKRGPKGGSKHPIAQKFGLSTAVFDRRLAYHVKQHALSGTKKEFKMSSVDFSVDPFAKPVEEVLTESTETTEVKTPLEVVAE